MNTRLGQKDMLIGKKRDEMLEQDRDVQFEWFQHPEKSALYQEAFAYYPEKWISPFIERRREKGWGVYGLLNIQKGEKAKIAQQQSCND